MVCIYGISGGALAFLFFFFLLKWGVLDIIVSYHIVFWLIEIGSGPS
jgi:hypothetical protein